MLVFSLAVGRMQWCIVTIFNLIDKSSRLASICDDKFSEFHALCPKVAFCPKVHSETNFGTHFAEPRHIVYVQSGNDSPVNHEVALGGGLHL